MKMVIQRLEIIYFGNYQSIKHLKDIEDDQRQDLSLLHEEAVKDEPGR